MYITLSILFLLILPIVRGSTNIPTNSSHDVQLDPEIQSTNNLSKSKASEESLYDQSKCFNEILTGAELDINELDLISLRNKATKICNKTLSNINIDYPEFEMNPSKEKRKQLHYKRVFVQSSKELLEFSQENVLVDKNVINADLFNSNGNFNNNFIITENNKRIRKRGSDDYYDLNETDHNETEINQNETMSMEDYLKRIKEFIFPKTWTWVLIFFHSAVFVIGLVGNTLVCVAVYRNHTMRTVTNYFIVNLAVADFLVILLCLPPSVIWDVTMTWFLGVALCKIVLYLQVRIY